MTQWNIDTTDIQMVGQFDIVIIFPTGAQAQWYLDNCYDHWPKLIVASADNEYPKNQTLRKTFLHNWCSNKKLTIVLFGWHCMQNMPTCASTNVVTLDKWIIESCRTKDASIYNELEMDWNPVKLARIIRALSETSTTRNSNFDYKTVKKEMYDFDKVPEWLINLIK